MVVWLDFSSEKSMLPRTVTNYLRTTPQEVLVIHYVNGWSLLLLNKQGVVYNITVFTRRDSKRVYLQ